MSNSKDNTYIESLKEVFGNLEGLTPEKLQGFVGETMKQLYALRDQLESQDPKVREEGIRMAQELKEVLESQMDHISKLVGEDPSQLAAMMANSNLMQDIEIFENAKEQFKHLKNSFSPHNKNKKVHQKINIIG